MDSRSPSTFFGILRHGKTEWNELGKIQGSADSPLTLEGREKTSAWFSILQQFGWQRILASDLGRVQQTVEILNNQLHLPVKYDQRLREQDWGDWEGLTIPFIQENHSAELERRVALGWEFSAPGGESRQEVLSRVLQSLREAAVSWPGQKILVVCHQGVIKCTLYSLLQRNFIPGEDPLLKHNSLHLLHFSDEAFRIHQLNIESLTTT